MGLEKLDLKGLGHFGTGKATFTLDTLNLPTAWEYIYQNPRLLLKVDQHGPVYAQAHPPTDIILFRRDAFQRHASWLVWLISPAFKHGSFTNFFRPLQDLSDPAALPMDVNITFTPSQATYQIEHEGLRCVTEICVPPGETAIAVKVTLTNLRQRPLPLTAIPVLRPYVNPALLAPWDKPEWYLRSAFCLDAQAGFSTQLLNAHTDASRRRVTVLWSGKENLSGAEISYEKFVGQGTFDNPEAVARGKLRMSVTDARAWGVYGQPNTLCAYPPVNALQYDFTLAKGETRAFRQVFALLPAGADGFLPGLSVAREAARWLEEPARESAVGQLQAAYEKLAATRTVETPDPALNRYANEWLPLQLDWVCALDRGWPSGLRGSRDSANDFTAMTPLKAAWSREIIQTLFSCQRRDGWFPRQYSALGRTGQHDLRGHVDAGCWVIELLYAYLCFTGDFSVLDVKLAWLDSAQENPLWEHALQALEFFLRAENLGPHGLCKLGEGDWLDAVNRAGLQGRGESVTVTCQTVIALTQISQLLEHLRATPGMPPRLPPALAEETLARYAELRAAFKRNLRAHALNSEGYFNGFCNDDGAWLFSPQDPDGARRVYGPASWFALSSGVAIPDLVPGVLKELDFLKCPAGYRLCWPPMGATVIPNVGRMGSGDVPPGQMENGTAYNQGSHGFLARGLAAAGQGDKLYEVLRCMLPYDQEKHPVEVTLTPPYALVNCWQEVPGFVYRGGMQFLTGSIAYALRAVYDWLCGIKPRLDGLAIDPCLPSAFTQVQAAFQFRGSRVALTILNPNSAQCGVKSMELDGTAVTSTVIDQCSGRTLFVAPAGLFKAGQTHALTVKLGVAQSWVAGNASNMRQ